MLMKTVALDAQNANVTLTTYVTPAPNEKRPAMLVIHGGGYCSDCSDREGEPIALAFLARGYQAFMLKYTLKPTDPYKPLVDASRAMEHIRRNAERYSVDPKRVFVVGFSAGGHLAATLGTMWKNQTLNQKAGIAPGSNRPTGTILCYPVIREDGHAGSFQNLLGEHADDPEWRQLFSADTQVDAESSPAFVIHTFPDATVPVNDSLSMAAALNAHGVMCELHVYPTGPHGMALATDVTAGGQEKFVDATYARWVDDACRFMDRIK